MELTGPLSSAFGCAYSKGEVKSIHEVGDTYEVQKTVGNGAAGDQKTVSVTKLIQPNKFIIKAYT